MGYNNPVLIWRLAVSQEEHRINVRVLPDLKRRVKSVAAAEGKTLADAVREALEAWLARRDQKLELD
jgi:predicted DNA-binding protein